MAPEAKENHLLGLRGERALAAANGHLVPMGATHLKKWPLMTQKFVHDRAKTYPSNASQPRHPTIQHRTTSKGGLSGWWTATAAPLTRTGSPTPRTI